MNRLIQAARRAAQTGGGHHAQTARDGGAFIREDVAEQVAGYHHVKLRRVQNELHGGVVHVHVADLDLRVFAAQALDRLAPQAAALQHVGLVHRAEPAAALFRHFKADARQTLDLRHGIGHLVRRRRAILAAPALAEVDVAGQLAQDHDVNRLGDDVRTERARAGELRVNRARAQVGKHLHALAQGEQPLFRAAGRLDRVPLRAADAAHQHRVRRVAGRQRLVRQRHAERVDGRAAEPALVKAERVAVFFRDGV